VNATVNATDADARGNANDADVLATVNANDDDAPVNATANDGDGPVNATATDDDALASVSELGTESEPGTATVPVLVPAPVPAAGEFAQMRPLRAELSWAAAAAAAVRAVGQTLPA
jgi:hypothetical protein